MLKSLFPIATLVIKQRVGVGGGYVQRPTMSVLARSHKTSCPSVLLALFKLFLLKNKIKITNESSFSVGIKNSGLKTCMRIPLHILTVIFWVSRCLWGSLGKEPWSGKSMDAIFVEKWNKINKSICPAVIKNVEFKTVVLLKYTHVLVCVRFLPYFRI